jgi:hypothetical protein
LGPEQSQLVGLRDVGEEDDRGVQVTPTSRLCKACDSQSRQARAKRAGTYLNRLQMFVQAHRLLRLAVLQWLLDAHRDLRGVQLGPSPGLQDVEAMTAALGEVVGGQKNVGLSGAAGHWDVEIGARPARHGIVVPVGLFIVRDWPRLHANFRQPEAVNGFQMDDIGVCRRLSGVAARVLARDGNGRVG